MPRMNMLKLEHLSPTESALNSLMTCKDMFPAKYCAGLNWCGCGFPFSTLIYRVDYASHPVSFEPSSAIKLAGFECFAERHQWMRKERSQSQKDAPYLSVFMGCLIILTWPDFHTTHATFLMTKLDSIERREVDSTISVCEMGCMHDQHRHCNGSQAPCPTAKTLQF